MKAVWWVLGVIAVVVIVALVFKSGRPAAEDLQPIDVETELPAGVEPTEDTTEGSVNAAVPAAALSYQAALAKYKDTRIQITEDCQAFPNRVTYKNGTDIMLDNRTGETKAIRLGSSFTIKAYGFKIVRASSSNLPATWLMDCDTSQNVATVLIQR